MSNINNGQETENQNTNSNVNNNELDSSSTLANKGVAKKSKSETGHAKNVANFDKLVTYIRDLGEVYNPGKQNIKLAQIEELNQIARESLDQYNKAFSIYTLSVSERVKGFEDLNAFITALHLNLKVYTDDSEKMMDIKSYIKKIRGTKMLKVVNTKGEEQKRYISTSRRSFDSILENFNRLISLIQSLDHYEPNEEDFKIEGLLSRYSKVKTMTEKVNQSMSELNIKRTKRDIILYDEIIGLIKVGKDARTYVKSLNINSIQKRAIQSIVFVSY